MFGVPTCGSGSTIVGWSGESGQCDCLSYIAMCWGGGTLSPSESIAVGLEGTLSSSDLARMLFPAVPAGIPFPVGPVGPYGTLSPSGLTLTALLGRCPRPTLNLLAHMGRCPRLQLLLLAPLAHMGCCTRLTLLARMGRCPRLTLKYCMGRCPRLTLTLLACVGS